MEVRALRENEKEECIALWRTVWPGDNDAYFRRYFEGDIEWLPYYTQVAVENGKLVSTVHICKRTVACGDFRLTMGGIANVATLLEYRGKGYNSACLRGAIAVMEADAMDFSLLFTGINAYYAREGFATIPRVRLRGTLRPPPGAPRAEVIWVRAACAEDLPQIFAVYDAYNRTRPIAVQRSPAYWRDWIGLKPEKLVSSDPPLVAVDSSGRIVGYIYYQVNFYQGHQITEDYAYISEYGELAEGLTEGVVALALLEAVAARALASGKRELHLSIALESSIRAAMKELCEDVRENVTDSAMTRLLHRENLLRSLLLEWNDHWIAAGQPRDAVVFETPYGTVKLDATGRLLKIEVVDETAGALSQGTLFGLLFGTMRAEQATANEEAHPLLAALFPERTGVYWSADGF